MCGLLRNYHSLYSSYDNYNKKNLHCFNYKAILHSKSQNVIHFLWCNGHHHFSRAKCLTYCHFVITFFTCEIENFSGQLAYFPFLVNISLIETLGKCLFLLNLLPCLLLCGIHLNVLSGIRSQHKLKIINSKFNLLWFCNRVVGVGQTTRQYINKNWEGEPVAYWIICVNPTLRLRLFPKLHNLL